MHYYNFNLNDFEAETAHLTHAERGLYITLINIYLRTEQPLTSDLRKLTRLARATDQDDLNAVLDDFFVLDGDVYRSERLDEIINEMNERSAKARESALKSVESRRNKRATVKRTLSERSATVERPSQKSNEQNKRPLNVPSDNNAQSYAQPPNNDLKNPDLASDEASVNDFNAIAQPSLSQGNTPAQPLLGKGTANVEQSDSERLATAERTLSDRSANVELPINPLTHNPYKEKSIKKESDVQNSDGFATAADAADAANAARPTDCSTGTTKPDKPKTQKRGTRLPDDFVLPDDWRQWAQEARPELSDARITEISEAFADHWHQDATPKARKLDWKAAWRTWVRRDKEFSQSRATGKQSTGPKPDFDDPDYYLRGTYLREDGTYGF